MTRWEELGMMAEEYVRSRWELVTPDDYREGAIYLEDAEQVKTIWKASNEAAAAFTADHEEQIKLKSEEIEWLQRKMKRSHPYDEAPKRILAVLNSQLVDLMKGWKK